MNGSGMRKILDDLKKAVSIAHTSLQAQANARTAKKQARIGSMPKPNSQPKKLPGKNTTDPMWLAKSVVEAARREPLTLKKSKPKKSRR
jgi:hypothetical protein